MEPIQQQIYTNLAHEGLQPGHHTRDHTAGIDGATKARYEDICNRWGVYEPGTEFRRALVQIPLWDEAPPPAPPSHFLLILTSNKGRDSQGRLGAVLRHIVRVSARQYESLEYHPFRFLEQGHLLEDWSPDTTLADIVPSPWSTDAAELQIIFPERYKLLRILLAHLLETGKMRIPVGADSMAVEELFGQVVTLAPLSWRPCLSLATYTFSNPDDYGLVAFHQRDARVRRALEELEEGDVPATNESVSRYLDDLFGAMRSNDWHGALALIHGTTLPDSTVPHPGAVLPDRGEAAPPADTTSNEADSPQVPGTKRRSAPAEPAHHPGWTASASSSPRKRRRGLRWLPILFLVVILGAAGWYVATRGGSNGNGRTDPATQLVSLRADGLPSLLDRHEQVLGQLLADGVRDSDLRVAMQTAAQTYGARVTQAMAADLRRLDRQLSPTDGTEDRELTTIASELQEFVDAAAVLQVRVAALEQVLLAADPAPIHAAYVDTSGRVSLDQLPAGAASPLGESCDQLMAALTAAADGLSAMAAETGYAVASWSTVAATLERAETGVPTDFGPPPRVVRAAHAATTAYVTLREAERRAGLGSAAAVLPYSTNVLRQGAVADAARALEARSVDLAAAGAETPLSLTRVIRFHELGRESRLKAPASLDNADAAELLTRLSTQCAAPARLPCTDPVYADHIARWQLEAWRALGGPESAAGRSVESALSSADRRTMAAMVQLVDRMSTSTNPAPGKLVDDVSAQARRHDSGLYQAICTDWLAHNQRQQVDQRDSFRRLYSRLQAQLTQLRDADNDAGPAAFAALQSTAREMSTLDLTALQATASLKTQVQAARQFQSALSRQHLVRIARIDLELLRSQDYADTRYQEAHPTIRISRVTGVSQRALYEYSAPAMPAAAATGFEPASLQMRTAVPLRAGDTLLLTAHEPGGSAWFHLYIKPPPGGHVAAALAGLHQVEVSADARRAYAANPDALPPIVHSGEVVATVRIVLQRGFWAELGQQFPDLP